MKKRMSYKAKQERKELVQVAVIAVTGIVIAAAMVYCTYLQHLRNVA